MKEDRQGASSSSDVVIKPWFPFGYGPLSCSRCHGFMAMDESSCISNLSSTLFVLKAREYRLQTPPGYVTDDHTYDLFLFVCCRCGSRHVHVVRNSKNKV